MTRKELQNLLDKYPEGMEVKFINWSDSKQIHAVTDETVVFYSDTAYVDTDAPEDEWDTEDGKFELGYGEKYILINAPVL